MKEKMEMNSSQLSSQSSSQSSLRPSIQIHPVQPVQSIQPVQPVQSIQPVQPVQLQSMQQTQSTQSVQSTQPIPQGVTKQDPHHKEATPTLKVFFFFYSLTNSQVNDLTIPSLQRKY